jgi:hypothetical protein
MKTILVLGLALGAAALAVPERSAAMPLPPAASSGPAATLLLPVRHHRHHRQRHHGSRPDFGGDMDYRSSDPDPVGEGQTAAPPYSVDGGAAAAGAPFARPTGPAGKPSIRWVDPDKPAR